MIGLLKKQQKGDKIMVFWKKRGCFFFSIVVVWVFILTYEDIALSETAIIVVGYTNNGTDNDWWLKKFSADGTEDTSNWNKTIDSGNGGDGAYAVAIDSNDNVYVAGTKTNIGTGYDDWWLKKFSADGTEDTSNWNKTFGTGSSITGSYPNSAAIDSNDNIYVVGKKADGNGDWWLKKFSADGTEDTTNWNKDIAGNNWDFPYSVAFDSSNNVYIVGSICCDDWWLKKFSADGTEDTTNWNKIIDSGSGTEDAQSVAIDSNDNIYVVGKRADGGNGDWWLKKFSADGTEDTTNWNKTFDGGNGNSFAKSVAIDLNNNVYVVGIKYNGANGDWWLKKFSADGTEDTTNWNKIFDGGNGDDIAYAVAVAEIETTTTSNNSTSSNRSTPNAPEIWLVDSVEPINDSNIDFGQLNEEKKSVTEIIKIYNTGRQDLEITKISVSGKDESKFSISQSGGDRPCNTKSPTIHPDDYCTISVTFKTSQKSKTMKASLDIASNDPDENPTYILLKGKSPKDSGGGCGADIDNSKIKDITLAGLFIFALGMFFLKSRRRN